MHRPPIETHPDNILCFRVANDIEVCVYAFVERDSVIGHVLDWQELLADWAEAN